MTLIKHIIFPPKSFFKNLTALNITFIQHVLENLSTRETYINPAHNQMMHGIVYNTSICKQINRTWKTHLEKSLFVRHIYLCPQQLDKSFNDINFVFKS